MKKKNTWVSIVPPLFNAGRIEFHTRRDTLIANMRSTGAECANDFLEDCIGACVFEELNHSGTMYVFVGDSKLTTLVHECFHAVTRYLAWIGVKLEHDAANETYAYLLEHLVEEFEPLLKRGK